MKEYNPTEQEEYIIGLMRGEVNDWYNGVVWVTNNTRYRMKTIIERARRNYLGQFKKENDEVLNRKKIFIPLTEDIVETVVKNIDLDSADINIRATNPNGFSSALIIRYLLNYFMKKNYFGEILNTALRLFAIDGTVVMKILKNYNPLTKKQDIHTRLVDITNFFIEPSEDNIQEAGAVIERNVLTLSETKDYDWDNIDYIKGFTNINKNYSIQNYVRTHVPMVEVYERWGDVPKWVFTKKEEDRDVWVPATCIVSNLFRHPVVHKIVQQKTRVKPYEEVRFRKIFGRWHGRGIGEILLGLQSYINETVNLRLQKSRISNVGLFKARKGSGITQQLLKSLISGGVIPVTRMDDIMELPISDVKASSYRDEEQVYQWGERVTGAWEIGKTGYMPSYRSATTAVLQEKMVKTGYDLLQENLGLFLSRVFEKHIIPLMLETISDEEVISIIGSPKDLKEIDENYINHLLNQNILDYLIKNHTYPPIDFVDNLRTIYEGNLQKFKNTRYFKINKSLLTKWKYEVEVFVTGESFNKAVMVKELNDLLITYSRIPGLNIDVEGVFKEILDLMGIGGARFLAQQKTTALPTPLPSQNKQALTPQAETEQTAEVVTPEKTGAGLTPTL